MYRCISPHGQDAGSLAGPDDHERRSRRGNLEAGDVPQAPVEEVVRTCSGCSSRLCIGQQGWVHYQDIVQSCSIYKSFDSSCNIAGPGLGRLHVPNPSGRPPDQHQHESYKETFVLHL